MSSYNVRQFQGFLIVHQDCGEGKYWYSQRSQCSLSCGGHTTTKATTLAPSTTTEITASPACGSLPDNLCPNSLPNYNGDPQWTFAYPHCCREYLGCMLGEYFYYYYDSRGTKTHVSIGCTTYYLYYIRLPYLTHLMVFYLQQCLIGEVFNLITLQCGDPSICDLYECLDEQFFQDSQGPFSCDNSNKQNMPFPKFCQYYITCGDNWLNYDGSPWSSYKGLVEVSASNHQSNLCCVLNSSLNTCQLFLEMP